MDKRSRTTCTKMNLKLATIACPKKCTSQPSQSELPAILCISLTFSVISNNNHTSTTSVVHQRTEFEDGSIDGLTEQIEKSVSDSSSRTKDPAGCSLPPALLNSHWWWMKQTRLPVYLPNTQQHELH